MRPAPASRAPHERSHGDPGWLEYARVASRTGRGAPERVEEDIDRTRVEEERRRTDWDRDERERVAGDRVRHEEAERERVQRERADRERTDARSVAPDGDRSLEEQRWDGSPYEPGRGESADLSDGSAPDPEERIAEEQRPPRADDPAERSYGPEGVEAPHTDREREAPSHLAPAQLRSVRGEAGAVPRATEGNGVRAYAARQRAHRPEAEASRRAAGARR